MTKHVKIAHAGAGRNFLCRICHKRFDRKSVLQQHWEAHKDDGERTTFQCKHCEAKGAFNSFTQKYNLSKHVRKYHQEA